MMLNADAHGGMVVHILQEGFHRPFVNGLSNREKIEDAIVMGIYTKELPAMDQEDVDWVCDLVDNMIIEYGAKK